MKDLNYISQQIRNGKELDDNLEKYAKGMSSMYNSYAYIKLSMNYYTLFDMISEKGRKSEGFDGLCDRFNKLIKEYVLGTGRDGLDEVRSLRQQIVRVMEVVTAYIDRLRIYEYVLNRVEYRFKPAGIDEEYYGTYFTNDIMHYILADKENIVVNSKISEIVGQLPIRMSKNKFFEYINEAFSLYHGAQKQTIDDFLYTLKTVSMLQDIKGIQTTFPDIYEMYKSLADAGYSDIDEAEYNRLKKILDIAIDKINDYADLFVLLAQVVNDVYTILLTDNYTVDAVKEVQIARDILQQINHNYTNNEIAFDDSVIAGFTFFEGRQERIAEVLSANEYIVNYVKLNYKNKAEKAGLLEIYEALSLAEKLQSGSDFVSLKEDPQALEVPEDSYADEVCAGLIEEIRNDFENKPAIVRRAVMASVLSQLPVFFNNVNEIVAYINTSLSGCTDPAEKAAVLEIVKDIIK